MSKTLQTFSKFIKSITVIASAEVFEYKPKVMNQINIHENPKLQSILSEIKGVLSFSPVTYNTADSQSMLLGIYHIMQSDLPSDEIRKGSLKMMAFVFEHNMYSVELVNQDVIKFIRHQRTLLEDNSIVYGL